MRPREISRRNGGKKGRERIVTSETIVSLDRGGALSSFSVAPVEGLKWLARIRGWFVGAKWVAVACRGINVGIRSGAVSPRRCDPELHPGRLHSRIEHPGITNTQIVRSPLLYLPFLFLSSPAIEILAGVFIRAPSRTGF